MATLTITQNPWEGSRFLISVHNPTKLIWTFQPTTDTKVITSTVTIGAYTFNGIETNKNTGATPDIYTYELNLTDILKYFHNSFYHKTVLDAISASLSTLVKSQLITVNGLEDGVSTDTEYVTTLLSHGVNQIGNAYGATMQKLYDRINSDRFHYFAGYPCELYWWTGPNPLSQWLAVDGLEIIDVDNKFHDAVELFKFIKDNFDLTGFLIIGTQSGGFHIYYRCPNPMGNLKLAMRQGTENIPGKAKKEVITLVETRGVGGYVVFYDNILQGSIETVPTITTEQRDELLTICRALNEVEDKKAHEPKIEINDNAEAPGNSYNNDYSSIAETKQILLNAGWVAQGDYYWRRPGKTDLGISASFGKVGKNKFYVFSSNASPFDMQCSYSMFAVRAYLLHNKDFSECGKLTGVLILFIFIQGLAP